MGRDLGILANGKLNRSEQCPGSQEDIHVLGHTRHSTASWSKNSPALLCTGVASPQKTALRAVLGTTIQKRHKAIGEHPRECHENGGGSGGEAS